MSPTRALPWIAAAGLGIAAEWVPYGLPGYDEPIVDVLVGWTLIGVGLLMRERVTAPRSATLLVAGGVAWFLPNFAVTGITAVDNTLSSLVLLHVTLLTVAILVLGTGRLQGAAAWIAAAAAVGVAVAGAAGGGRFVLPLAGSALVVAALVAWQSEPARAATAPLGALLAGVLVGAELFGSSTSRTLTGVSAVLPTVRAHEAVLVLAALLVMLEATSRPLRHTAIELGGAGGGEIRAALARALGDPALAVAFPDGEGAWLDPVGRPCAVPREHVREIRDGETLVAVLGATAAFGSDVRERLTEVLRLGGENARLRRSVTGQLAELDASRRRLLEAGDNERRQLEALLRRGALARLAAIAEELAAAPGLERPLAQVAVTRNELEDIAHGLDPLARGTPLSVALDELAARSPNQVDVDVAGGPFAEDAERTIWFACAEAVANASKHAPGAPISITVGPEAGGVLATIADDGPGGADPTGSGLHGLADRASVLGGSLAVDSEFGLGTRIVLRLPAGRSGQLVHPARAVADATAGLAP